jgi:hypothetical protein
MDLAALLRMTLVWEPTKDVDVPWRARAGSNACTLRLGDFPAEPLYTVLVDGRELGTVDEWPATWSKLPHDDSTRADDVRGSVQLTAPVPPHGSGVEREGRVTALVREADGATRVIMGDFAFFATMPQGTTLPFDVGDDLAFQMRDRIDGIHFIRDAMVAVRGALALASMGSGDASWIDGWEIETARSASNSPPLYFRRGGRLAIVQANLWRRIEIDQGKESWLLSGHAAQVGPGPVVPDARSYRRFDVLRER